MLTVRPRVYLLSPQPPTTNPQPWLGFIVNESLLRFEDIGVRMVPALSYLEPEVI